MFKLAASLWRALLNDFFKEEFSSLRVVSLRGDLWEGVWRFWLRFWAKLEDFLASKRVCGGCRLGRRSMSACSQLGGATGSLRRRRERKRLCLGKKKGGRTSEKEEDQGNATSLVQESAREIP